MRYSALIPVLLLLGCEGHLIEGDFPGTNQPPTTNAALAFRFGGSGSEEIADLASDSQGNAYVAGTFSDTPDFDPGVGISSIASLGSTDGFLAKYSPTGNLLFVSRLGGTAAETVTALARDASGNLYLGGNFSGSTDFDPGPGLVVLNSLGGQDGYVAKYSASGDLIWVRRFGGTGLDEVSDVAVDVAGNVYAGGTFSGQANASPAGGPTIIADGSAADGFILALDPSGSVRWALPVGGAQDDAVLAIAVTSTGAVTAAGTFLGSADFARNTAPIRLAAQGGADLFLATYTGAGFLAWVRDIGGTNADGMPAGGLTVDGQDGAVLLGNFAGSADFDPGPGIATRSSVSASDLFLARYDSNGNFSSVLTVGGTGSIAGMRTVTDADGSALVTGFFSGAIDFDPGAGTTSLSSLGQSGATDVFTARYSAGGALQWVTRFGEVTSVGDRSNSGAALALDGSGNVIVAGRFFGSPDFDPSGSALVLVSVGESDGFVVKLASDGKLATTP